MAGFFHVPTAFTSARPVPDAATAGSGTLRQRRGPSGPAVKTSSAAPAPEDTLASPQTPPGATASAPSTPAWLEWLAATRGIDAAARWMIAGGRPLRADHAAGTPRAGSPPPVDPGVPPPLAAAPGLSPPEQQLAQLELVFLHRKLADWRAARDRSSVTWQAAEERLQAIAGSGVASLRAMWQLLGPQSVVLGLCTVACVVGAFVTTPLGLLLAAGAALGYLLVAQAWLLVPAHLSGTSDRAGATLAVRRAQLITECYDELIVKGEALLEEARRPATGERPRDAHLPLTKLNRWGQSWASRVDAVSQACRREVAAGEGASTDGWSLAGRMATTYVVGSLQPHRSLLATAVAAPVLIRTWLQETLAARSRALTQARRALGASGDPADGFDASERLALAEAVRRTLGDAIASAGGRQLR